jgi:hypothetical protein
MKAYKAFNKDWTCRGFKFEVGKTYTHDGEIQLCNSGFHACKNISDCFKYYDFSENTIVAEVEVFGKKIEAEDDSKIVCSKIKIKKEIKWVDVLELCNRGNCNSGNCNSGDCNSGNCNSGNWNSGNCNSGNWNSGNCNSGNWNSGNWNSGDCNSGIFNTNSPDKIRVFNKWISRDKFKSIKIPSFLYFDLTQFVSYDFATEEEKKKYKNDIETCGGFLKTLDYKDAFKRAWNNASEEDKKLVLKIPGFTPELFKEISGIEV